MYRSKRNKDTKIQISGMDRNAPDGTRTIFSPDRLTRQGSSFLMPQLLTVISTGIPKCSKCQTRNSFNAAIIHPAKSHDLEG